MWGEIIIIDIDEEEKKKKTKKTENTKTIFLKEQVKRDDCLALYMNRLEKIKNKPRKVVVPPMETQMVDAMELHKYVNDMKNVVNNAELAIKYNIDMVPDVPDSTSLPDVKASTRNIIRNKPFNFLHKQYSLFSLGFGPDPPTLSRETRQKIQVKSIATICGHIGYKSITSTSLQFLSDLLETFLSSICKDLRNANDMLLTEGTSGFPDIVEKVFTEYGLGGIHGVLESHEKRLNKYENILVNRTQETYSRYENLVEPNPAPMEEPEEKEAEPNVEDIPEVHFTITDGEEGYLQQFLESGFQMLNSLEEGQYST